MTRGGTTPTAGQRAATSPGRCPICQRPRPPQPVGPFCSERCRLVDLQHWLGGSYRIAPEPFCNELGGDVPRPAAGEDHT